MENNLLAEHKKLSRRDAIKLIGATAGASALTQIPSKWSKPSLVGGMIPIHAQTSGCGPGTMSMLVEFLKVDGSKIAWKYGATDTFYQNNLIQTTGTPSTTGFTIFFPCFDGCGGFIFSVGRATATVKVTINGAVVGYWVDATGIDHSVLFNAAAGEIGVDEPVDECGGGGG